MNQYENTMKDTSLRYSVVNIFSTEGRVGRQTYFVYSIVLPFLLFLVLSGVLGLVKKLNIVPNVLFYGLFTASVIAVLYLIVRLTIQRCHDFNAKSALALFAVIPFANIIFALIQGDNGLNSYGEAPKPASTFDKVATKILSALIIALMAYAIVQFFGLNLKDILNDF